MNCINMKVKLNHTLYCKKYNKEIKLSDCKHCKLLEYATIQQKHIKINKYSRNNKYSLYGLKTPLKKVSKKQAKMERDRYSILTDDLDHCILCGKKKDNLHECIYGKNRLNSIKYHFVIPLCQEHHTGKNGIHFNKELDLYYKQLCQTYFEKNIGSRTDFIDIFKINYL